MKSGGDLDFVAIEGVIAAGKSTAVALIAEKLGANPVFEQFEDNPFLGAFGEDPKSCGLETEITFLLLHHFGLKGLDSGVRHVADYSLQKDLVFAMVNLEGEDLDLFKNLYGPLVRRSPAPRRTIFLDVPLWCLSERLKKRGRTFEELFPIEYLEKLRSAYLELLDENWPNSIRVEVRPEDSAETVADNVISLLS